MKKTVTITDLTRMSGPRVCIAGYLADGTCVRPVFAKGQLEDFWLYDKGQAAIQPFALIEFEMGAVIGTGPSISKPPHTEDVIIDPRYRRIGLMPPDQREAFLARIDDGDVADIFGAEIHDNHGYYVLFGEGNRSLGTVRPQQVMEVLYFARDNGKWDYRLSFEDGSGRRYRLAVTDLAFRNYLDYRRAHDKLSPQEIARVLTQQLQAAHVFLRVGLARNWQEHLDRCYLQINGVYSFPDYLGGHCFADFLPAGC